MSRLRPLSTVAGLALLTAAAGPAGAQTALPEILIEAPRNPEGARRDLGLSEGQLQVIDRAFVPVTVVPESEIRRNGGGTLGDQLNNLPGVTSSSFAPGGASRPIIRGLDNTRVRMQENGIGAQDVSDLSEDHAVPIDPLAAERIEVIRGPAALRFGSQAIGGVVNVTNERIPHPPRPARHQRHGDRLALLGRQWHRRRHARARLVGPVGLFRRHLRPQRRRLRDAAGAAGQFLRPHLRRLLRRLLLLRPGLYRRGHLAVPLALRHSRVESAANRTRIDMIQTRLTSKGEIRFDGQVVDNIRFWLGGTLYRHNEQALDAGQFQTAATFRNQEIEGRVETAFRPLATPLGTLNSVFGVQFGAARLGTSGEAGGCSPRPTAAPSPPSCSTSWSSPAPPASRPRPASSRPASPAPARPSPRPSIRSAACRWSSVWCGTSPP